MKQKMAPTAVFLILFSFILLTVFQNCAPAKMQTQMGQVQSKNSQSTLTGTRTLASGTASFAVDCVGAPEVSRITACPSGQSGSIGQVRKVTTTVCPAEGGNFSYTYSEWVDASNTCNSKCTGNPVLSQTISCGAGQTGEITQTRSASSVTCGASGTNNYTYTGWTTSSSTCSGGCSGTPEAMTQTISCGAGYFGVRNQTRTLLSQMCSSAGGATVFNYSPWTDVSTTCFRYTPAGSNRVVCSPTPPDSLKDLNSTQEVFIRKAYCDLLGGEPDQAGFESWLNKMNTQGYNRQRVLLEMALSDEMLIRFNLYSDRVSSTQGYFESLYRIIGGRLPDAAGLNSLSSATTNNTLENLRSVAGNFLASTLMNEVQSQDKWGVFRN